MAKNPNAWKNEYDLEVSEEDERQEEEHRIPAEIIPLIRDFFEKYGVAVRYDRDFPQRMCVDFKGRTSVKIEAGVRFGELSFETRVDLPNFSLDMDAAIKALKKNLKKIMNARNFGYVDMSREGYTDKPTKLVLMAKDIDFNSEERVMLELKRLMEILEIKVKKDKDPITRRRK